MQMSSLKTPVPCCEAGNPKDVCVQARPHPSSCLYMANGPVSRENCFFHFVKCKKNTVSGMKNASQNMHFSHFVGDLTFCHKYYSLAYAGYITIIVPTSAQNGSFMKLP